MRLVDERVFSFKVNLRLISLIENVQRSLIGG